MNYNHKKMKKNGYIEVESNVSVEEVNKGDKVYVSATEFGQLEDDSMVTCITEDDKEVIIKKRDLIVK